ncbi:Predicted metal-binding protein related to the C-terminal domain of SecA [Streptococcus pneumoniae]|uniref:YecA family protein n=1 Tax=Bacillus cereus group sp. Bce001 TaxID=3445260 RepID=UPI0005DA8D32|nr:nucleic acid-binding protein [Bacillus cereus]ONG79607.1 nucleic acid-binding protein [Bacillus cereus]COF40547.1 Predicted metal-binding protein related to the C-terminal domain of SecA [Streptococcus pneumoniae]COS02556.1 Predicted metal-binding protein related to the C-terminal domain of SecA [Streptococcus pneumoniae]
MYERNEPCPCGSGRKYKKCCINKIENPVDVWKQKAIQLSLEINNNKNLVDTYFAVFNHAMRKQWIGACHALSSILYILLKEQGFKPNLEIGFTESSKVPFSFCHSWITLDGFPYDVGLYRSHSPFQHDINPYLQISAPIFKGIDIESGVVTNISFGVSSDRESIDNNFKRITNMTLVEYMENWPNHKDGLFGETIEIAEKIGLTLKIDDLKTRYYEDRFHISVVSS